MAKKFDFKQFMLQKGEMVGLGLAGVLLLAVGLTSLVSGLFAGSPSKMAKDLTAATEKVQNGLSSNQPSAADMPGETTGKTGTFDYKPVEKPEQYAFGPIIDVLGGSGSSLRRLPDIFKPEEARVEIAMVGLRIYRLEKKGDGWSICYLKDSGSKQPGALDKSGRDRFAKMYGGPKGGKGPGMPNMPAMPGSSDDRAPGPGKLPPGTFEAGKITQEMTEERIPLTQVDTLGSVKLSESLKPQRMALIAASFPYKTQLEEFRTKLRLSSIDEVLGEVSLEVVEDPKTKQKTAVKAFRFLGVDLERSEVRADGKQSDWTKVDVVKDLQPYFFHNGKRVEDEDPRLTAVSFPGLVVGKPVLHEGSKYPDVESQLPLLQKTLDALGGKNTFVPKPPEAFDNDFDPFNTGGGDTFGNSKFPGGGMMYPGAGGTDAPPSGVKIKSRGSFTPSAGPPGYGPGYLLPRMGKPGQPGDRGDKGDQQQEYEVDYPERCLIRLIDVRVEPGKTYQYRMRVRMGNPVYGRKDAASPDFATRKELVGGWYTIEQKVSVPPELVVYAVDQEKTEAKDAEPKDPEMKDKKPPVFTGINAKKTPATNQVVLQIHRWLDHIPLSKESGPRPVMIDVGDWSIAERVFVTRGEYAGTDQRTDVPHWRPLLDAFAIAIDPKTKKERIEVGFHEERPDGNRTILVDFEGGKMEYEKGAMVKTAQPADEEGKSAPVVEPKPRAAGTVVKDTTSIEVMLLSPDGKLLVHDSGEDSKDQVRRDRLRAWRERIKEVKNGTAKTDGPPKTPGGPFGPGTGDRPGGPGGGDR
jgi:hypothetical protein